MRYGEVAIRRERKIEPGIDSGRYRDRERIRDR